MFWCGGIIGMFVLTSVYGLFGAELVLLMFLCDSGLGKSVFEVFYEAYPVLILLC